MTAADDPDDYLMHLIHSTPEDTLLALEDAGKAPEKLSIKDRKAAAMSAAIESFSYDVHVMLGIKLAARHQEELEQHRDAKWFGDALAQKQRIKALLDQVTHWAKDFTEMPESLGMDIAEKMGIDPAGLPTVLSGRVRTETSPREQSDTIKRRVDSSTDDDSSEDSDEDEGSRRKHNLETTGVVSRGRLGKPQDATAIRNLKVERMARAAEIKASLGFGTSMGKAGSSKPKAKPSKALDFQEVPAPSMMPVLPEDANPNAEIDELLDTEDRLSELPEEASQAPRSWRFHLQASRAARAALAVPLPAPGESALRSISQVISAARQVAKIPSLEVGLGDMEGALAELMGVEVDSRAAVAVAVLQEVAETFKAEFANKLQAVMQVPDMAAQLVALRTMQEGDGMRMHALAEEAFTEAARRQGQARAARRARLSAPGHEEVEEAEGSMHGKEAWLVELEHACDGLADTCHTLSKELAETLASAQAKHKRQTALQVIEQECVRMYEEVEAREEAERLAVMAAETELAIKQAAVDGSGAERARQLGVLLSKESRATQSRDSIRDKLHAAERDLARLHALHTAEEAKQLTALVPAAIAPRSPGAPPLMMHPQSPIAARPASDGALLRELRELEGYARLDVRELRAAMAHALRAAEHHTRAREAMQARHAREEAEQRAAFGLTPVGLTAQTAEIPAASVEPEQAVQPADESIPPVAPVLEAVPEPEEDQGTAKLLQDVLQELKEIAGSAAHAMGTAQATAAANPARGVSCRGLSRCAGNMVGMTDGQLQALAALREALDDVIGMHLMQAALHQREADKAGRMGGSDKSKEGGLCVVGQGKAGAAVQAGRVVLDAQDVLLLQSSALALTRHAIALQQSADAAAEAAASADAAQPMDELQGSLLKAVLHEVNASVESLKQLAAAAGIALDPQVLAHRIGGPIKPAPPSRTRPQPPAVAGEGGSGRRGRLLYPAPQLSSSRGSSAASTPSPPPQAARINIGDDLFGGMGGGKPSPLGPQKGASPPNAQRPSVRAPTGSRLAGPAPPPSLQVSSAMHEPGTTGNAQGAAPGAGLGGRGGLDPRPSSSASSSQGAGSGRAATYNDPALGAVRVIVSPGAEAGVLGMHAGVLAASASVGSCREVRVSSPGSLPVLPPILPSPRGSAGQVLVGGTDSARISRTSLLDGPMGQALNGGERFSPSHRHSVDASSWPANPSEACTGPAAAAQQGVVLVGAPVRMRRLSYSGAGSANARLSSPKVGGFSALSGLGIGPGMGMGMGMSAGSAANSPTGVPLMVSGGAPRACTPRASEPSGGYQHRPSATPPAGGGGGGGGFGTRTPPGSSLEEWTQQQQQQQQGVQHVQHSSGCGMAPQQCVGDHNSCSSSNGQGQGMRPWSANAAVEAWPSPLLAQLASGVLLSAGATPASASGSPAGAGAFCEQAVSAVLSQLPPVYHTIVARAAELMLSNGMAGLQQLPQAQQQQGSEPMPAQLAGRPPVVANYILQQLRYTNARTCGPGIAGSGNGSGRNSPIVGPGSPLLISRSLPIGGNNPSGNVRYTPLLGPEPLSGPHMRRSCNGAHFTGAVPSSPMGQGGLPGNALRAHPRTSMDGALAAAGRAYVKRASYSGTGQGVSGSGLVAVGASGPGPGGVRLSRVSEAGAGELRGFLPPLVQQQ